MVDDALNLIEPGTIIGPYRVLRGFKAGGGMARIFKVEVRQKYRRPDLPTQMALKVARQEFQDALVAESDFLSRFNHPNVVRILPLASSERPVYAARHSFSFGWGWYYTMEWINGPSLDDHLTRSTTITDLLRPASSNGHRLSILQTLGVSRQLAAALAHIHKQQVVNLDVKPGNVLFRRQRWHYLRGSVPPAVLCDFGIARDLRYPRTGLLGVATPEYVSPEQACEKDGPAQIVDARADLFSLGVVLYEMLTGELPFEDYRLTVDPDYVPAPPRQLRPDTPAQLEAIVMRVLKKDPAERFQSADDMRTALEAVPMPADWKATARRTFAGLALTACVVGAGLGLNALGGDDGAGASASPTGTPSVVPSPTARWTSTLRPTTRTFDTPSATAGAPTSTLQPTPTPTSTPRPVLPTATPVAQSWSPPTNPPPPPNEPKPTEQPPASTSSPSKPTKQPPEP